MEKQFKLIFGAILAELFTVQKKQGGADEVSDEVIRFLKFGVEPIIDEYLQDDFCLTSEKYEIIANYFDELDIDTNRKENLRGAYDIENALENKGISRSDILVAIEIFRDKKNFKEIIDKISDRKNGHSAIEYHV